MLILTCGNCGKIFERDRQQCPRTFCSRSCHYAQGIGNPEDRFWKKVDKTAPYGCWLWLGCTPEGSGYGRFLVKGEYPNAHRYSWILKHGPIPEELFVLHDCDIYYPAGDITYRRCVNPDHLHLGTNADNMRECSQKDRIAHRKGENGNNAKLTDVQVRGIWKLKGTMLHREIAALFGVSRSLIWAIYHKRTWAHLDPSLP